MTEKIEALWLEYEQARTHLFGLKNPPPIYGTLAEERVGRAYRALARSGQVMRLKKKYSGKRYAWCTSRKGEQSGDKGQGGKASRRWFMPKKKAVGLTGKPQDG